MAKNGAWYHEPPYTWEEPRDFYRALSGVPLLSCILRCLRKLRSRSAANRRRHRRKNGALR
jgi:hypothetical protein